ASCGSSGGTGNGSGALRVVAAENVWGNIASQIGGSDVRVTSIITSPTADPHLYESSPRDAAAIAGADLVISNGLGYDDFMAKLTGAAGKHGDQLLVVADVLHVRGRDPNP